MVGINDCENLGMINESDFVPLSLIKFKYEKTGAHVFPLFFVKV
jgi:hypothetical protein